MPLLVETLTRQRNHLTDKPRLIREKRFNSHHFYPEVIQGRLPSTLPETGSSSLTLDGIVKASEEKSLEGNG